MPILLQTRAFRQKVKAVFIPTAVALFLTACSGTNQITESLKNEAYSSSEFYINRIEQAKKLEEQQSYRLLAVRKLVDENKIAEAQDTLRELNVEKLNEIQQLEYQLLTAQLYAAADRNSQALAQLARLPQALMSQSQMLRYYQTQARIAENQKNVLDEVRARSLMDHYLIDNRTRQENNNKVWEILRNANRGMLEQAQAGVGEAGFAGWLALVNVYNQNVSTPSQLPQAIENWKQQYPNHTANRLLPNELQNVSAFQQTQLNGVALLLPLSGEAKILGDIIKRGFDDAKGADTLPVSTFDTDSAEVDDLILQAKSQGAQTIIGPLLKPRVDAMLRSTQISDVNVLALNSTPNARAVARVCYYGLSPEAEAQSGADRFYRDGLNNAVVIAPQGDFGQRSADAFAQRWRQLTNKDTDVRYYHEPLDSVAALQNNGVSENAGIYILGTADQLLEIKQGIDNSPLANQFPIYTSSRSNSPNNGAEFRISMEGVKFSEIPLLADADSDAYKKADELVESDFSMMRLYAMGSDAWAIVNKFNEFRQIPGFRISGLTGGLTAGPNCNIQRQMTWLQYRNGSVVSAN